MLTPLGRGQAQLVTGLPGSGKTLAAVDTILGQASSGVRCVYASVTQSGARQARAIEALRAGGAMDYTTVVAAPEGASAFQIAFQIGTQNAAPEGKLMCGSRRRKGGYTCRRDAMGCSTRLGYS